MDQGTHMPHQTLVLSDAADRCEVFLVDPRTRRRASGRPWSAAREVSLLAETFRALGDPTRVRILDALSHAELCVCDLATLARPERSRPCPTSCALLRSLRLVRARREGRMVFYALDDDHIVSLFREGLRHVEEAVPEGAQPMSHERPRGRSCPACALRVHAESVFRVRRAWTATRRSAILERRLRHLPGLEDFSADVMSQRLQRVYDAARLSAAAASPTPSRTTGMRAWLEHEQPRVRAVGTGRHAPSSVVGLRRPRARGGLVADAAGLAGVVRPRAPPSHRSRRRRHRAAGARLPRGRARSTSTC